MVEGQYVVGNLQGAGGGGVRIHPCGLKVIVDSHLPIALLAPGIAKQVIKVVVHFAAFAAPGLDFFYCLVSFVLLQKLFCPVSHLFFVYEQAPAVGIFLKAFLDADDSVVKLAAYLSALFSVSLYISKSAIASSSGASLRLK